MKNLNWFKISSLYIGAIMGAGFASGRECWQYFGVFGNDGFKGIILITLGFVALSFMMTYNARCKESCDIGKVVSPFNNNAIDNVLGIILAINFYMVLASMSAAGGSLLTQEFGINKMFGGLLIVGLTVYTVLGNFKRISKVLAYISPVLFVICLATIILVITRGYEQSGDTAGFDAGGISPNWWISALIYLSYNSMAMITISGNTALTAKSRKDLYFGALIGSVLLGILTMFILRALTSDMAFSDALDLPMLGFASRLSSVLNILYAILLYFAIYSASSVAYYAFSTKIPYGEYRNAIIIIGAILAFFIGLIGFKKIVEMFYSIMGYIGLVYILLIIINFIIQLKKNHFKMK